MPPALPSDVRPKRIPGELIATELFFRDHQVWLEERGYMLRSRYKSDWVPSWKGTDKFYVRCFDGQATVIYSLLTGLIHLPATPRSSDGLWTLFEFAIMLTSR